MASRPRPAVPYSVCVLFWLRPKLPPQAVAELVALSDELNINEVACVELWSHVRTEEKCTCSNFSLAVSFPGASWLCTSSMCLKLTCGGSV